MPELSCADYTFPLLTRLQSLALLRLLDFQFVDLGLFERNAHVQTSAMLASPRQFAASLVEDIQLAGLSVADVFLQIGTHPQDASTNDPDARVRAGNRDVFEQSLELCAALSCRHMTGLPGVSHGESERDFIHAAEEAQWRVDVCRRSGVTYAIEPHIGSICSSVAATQRLVEATPGLTLTLDYGHFIAAGCSSEEVHPLLTSASHLHLRGGAPGRLQTGVADNTIDFEAVLERLRALNYEGLLALEYVWVDWEGCNQSDTLSETILLRQAVQAFIHSGQGKAGRHV